MPVHQQRDRLGRAVLDGVDQRAPVGGEVELPTRQPVHPAANTRRKERDRCARFDGKLMAVPTLASGSTLRLGTPLALFQTRMAGSRGGYFRPQYDVVADGRFLINHLLEDAASPITVILNWTPE